MEVLDPIFSSISYINSVLEKHQELKTELEELSLSAEALELAIQPILHNSELLANPSILSVCTKITNW